MQLHRHPTAESLVCFAQILSCYCWHQKQASPAICQSEYLLPRTPFCPSSLSARNGQIISHMAKPASQLPERALVVAFCSVRHCLVLGRPLGQDENPGFKNTCCKEVQGEPRGHQASGESSSSGEQHYRLSPSTGGQDRYILVSWRLQGLG
jgi:hypothetical protein